MGTLKSRCRTICADGSPSRCVASSEPSPWKVPPGVALQGLEHGPELTALVFGPGASARRLQQHRPRSKRCDPGHQIVGLSPEVETTPVLPHVLHELAEDDRLPHELCRANLQPLRHFAWQFGPLGLRKRRGPASAMPSHVVTSEWDRRMQESSDRVVPGRWGAVSHRWRTSAPPWPDLLTCPPTRATIESGPGRPRPRR